MISLNIQKTSPIADIVTMEQYITYCYLKGEGHPHLTATKHDEHTEEQTVKALLRRIRDEYGEITKGVPLDASCRNVPQIQDYRVPDEWVEE